MSAFPLAIVPLIIKCDVHQKVATEVIFSGRRKLHRPFTYRVFRQLKKCIHTALSTHLDATIFIQSMDAKCQWPHRKQQ